MSHSLSKLYVHLVFSTKQREALLLSPLREKMHANLATILKEHDSPALKVGGTTDHVRILFRLSKNSSLAKIVEEAKTSSSRGLRRKGASWRISISRVVTADFR